MNAHDQQVRITAYNLLRNCYAKKVDRVYSVINLFLHFPPFVPTVLQGSYIDKFYERLEQNHSHTVDRIPQK
jgi:hypothetical protein